VPPPAGALIDIDGVLTVSWQPVPGAPEALAVLRERGLPFVLVTNTTSQRRDDIVSHLADAGFAVGPDDILTTASITAAVLVERFPGAAVEVLNSGDVTDDLVGVTVVERDGDVVVLGGAGPEFTWAAMNRVLEGLGRGVPLVAMNPNLIWRTSDGVRLDAGAYLLALEAASGVTALVTGKPAPQFFRTALDRIGCPPERAVMVGDDLRTDVLGAQAFGIRGVLVRTGKYRPSDLERTEERPDVVVDSFADVPSLLFTGDPERGDPT
jgi:HAD superfamily hydrolase (TIGR01458 family)